MKPRVKIGKYKMVFKGIIFEIQQAKAVFPSGKMKIFEQAVRPPSVTILALDDKKRLLLTREYRVKYKKYLWRLPGGRVQEGERPLVAAQREFREEAGFCAKHLKLFHTTNMGQAVSWTRYAYLATGLTPAPLMGDEDEDITIVPTPLPNVMDMIRKDMIKNEAMAYIIFKLCNKMGVR